MLTDPKSLEMIQSNAVKAHGNRVFTVQAEPPHVYFIEGEGGKLEAREAEFKPANDKCLTLDSLCEWIYQIKFAENSTREIWIGDRGVCAAMGRQFASYAFENSDPFTKLREWAGLQNATKELSQTELYRLIRTMFRGCLPDEPSLASKIGKVDIKKAQEATGTVASGKVSVSKSMMAEASGATELPDLLSFKVPLFKTSPLNLEVRVNAAFDLDPQNETFRVAILPGEIDRAIHQGRVYLRSLVDARLAELKSENIEVYFGEPSKP